MNELEVEALETELAMARDEIRKLHALLVAAVAYYMQDAPRAEQIAAADTVSAAMDAVTDDWMQLFGNYAHVGKAVMAELKKIGRRVEGN